jgi:hypothetical protein
MPNLWKEALNPPQFAAGGGNGQTEVAIPRAVVAAVWNPGSSVLLPSAASIRWDWNTARFYSTVKKVFGEDVTIQVDIEVADRITKVVHSRLESELPGRLADRGRKAHWAFQWFRSNAWLFVTVLLALGKLKTGTQFVRDGGCHILLPTQWPNYAVGAASCAFAGAYAHLSTLDGYFCRVGKASGEGGIAQRQVGHEKGSKLEDSASVASTFYCHWPWDGKGVNGIPPRGRFQDLQVYVVAAFDHKNQAVVDALTCDRNPLCFDWSVGKDEVRRCKGGGSTVPMRRVTLVAYGFELVGDLLLDLDHNESCAPGMEVFTGDLGKA